MNGSKDPRPSRLSLWCALKSRLGRLLRRRPRRPARTPSRRAALGFQQLESREVLSGYTPTGLEQEFLERLNDARANPTAYGLSVGVDLSAVSPSQPLAFNTALIQSSRDHSTDMSANNYFAHNSLNGTTPFQRMNAAGYAFSGAAESIAAGYASPEATLASLIIDAYTPSLGHREQLLSTGGAPYTSLKETGVGHALGQTSDNYSDYWTIDSGYITGTSPILTGVAYNDANHDGLYDDGEGLGGVTITAVGGGHTYMTTTWSSGGYSLFLPAGSYTVTAVGLAGAPQNVTIGSSNYRLNFPTASTTTLTSSLNPSYLGLPVTFTATVTEPGGTPAGSVTFYDNGVALGPAVTVNAGGVATFTTSSLAGGAHPITAVYGGDTTYAVSSAGLTETVRQAFQPGDVVVEAVGTAAEPATTYDTSAPVSLAEYNTTTANQAFPLNNVGLPQVGTSGATPNALTTSSTAFSFPGVVQGLLHLSTNGSYLTTAGYNASPGRLSIAETPTTGQDAVVRVVGRIDGNGNSDTTTSTTDFSGTQTSAGTPFGAVSTDGNQFYVFGSGTPSAPGMRYIASLGHTGAAVGIQDGAPGGSQVIPNPQDAALTDGTLYADSAAPPSIAYYGTPGTLPTTNGQNTTTLPGVTAAHLGYTMGLAVLDVGHTGSANLIYLADLNNYLEKYALVGGSWVYEGQLLYQLFGLAAALEADGTTVDLYGVTYTAGGTGNSLLKIVDAAGRTGTISGTATTLATASANTSFRGVSFSPSITGTTTTLVSSLNPAGVNDSVTYTATVKTAGGAAVTAGAVNFYNGGTLIGTGTVNAGGQATVSTSFAATGTYSIVAVYTGNAGTNAIAESAALSQVVTQAPVLTATTVNGNNAALAGPQRSLVSSIVLTFDHAVTLAAGAVTIALHPNVKVNNVTQAAGYGMLPTLSYSSPDNGVTWVVTFSGNGVVNHSIADGIYDLTVNHLLVTDGQARMLPADQVFTFYRLFGDADGNRKVNNADLAILASAFNKHSNQTGYLAYLDYDGNGVINNSDLAQFASRFNTTFSGF